MIIVPQRRTVAQEVNHPQPAIKSLNTWYAVASKAKWQTPQDVKQTFPKASILKSGRVVFNIYGNKYRLIVKINYELQAIQVRFFDTHQAYDKIDADTI